VGCRLSFDEYTPELHQAAIGIESPLIGGGSVLVLSANA